MIPSVLARHLKRAIRLKLPVIMWSKPGAGKSDIGRQIAADLTRLHLDWRASLFDAVDLRGIPQGKQGLTHWLQPAFLPRDNTPTLIVLDELNRAPLSVQNALLQLTLDRRLGDYTLPDTCEIIACCNKTGRGVTPMPEALVSRFIHYTLEVDVDDWCKWAALNGINPAIIAFIRFRPDLIDMAGTPGSQEPYPCPRTWYFLSRLMDDPDELDLELCAGVVGEGAAIEFIAFLKLYLSCAGLIDSILLNPDTASVPTDPATMFAVSSALARRANVKTFDRIVKYSKRMPSKEYAVYCIKDAVRRSDVLKATPAFNTWAIDNADVIF